MPVAIDRDRLAAALARELNGYERARPRSRQLADQARSRLFAGVPMPWMVRWPGPFPLFVEWASGSRLVDVDGHEYVDFCLGDSGAMAGHAPAPTLVAIREQLPRGLTSMLPTADVLVVGDELTRRFGLPLWQFALTATDANRFAIRLARQLTGRPKILVFNWCYHGTVDETFATLVNGRVVARAGNIGPPVDLALTTRVVEWNDIEALERELAHGDVACILAEPALTNIGIVLPDRGFHEALREATRRHGTLLVLDETHTISVGPGGATRAWGLESDLLTLGKPIAGGVPAAVYGLSAAVGERLRDAIPSELSDTGGIGGTLAANALGMAAMRATLEEVLTEEAYDRMLALGERFASGVESVVSDFGLPWTVARLGCRVEYWFRATPPRNGSEAAAAVDPLLDRYLHVAALNRGVLLTPFHNMALLSPATTAEHVDRHTAALRDSLASL